MIGLIKADHSASFYTITNNLFILFWAVGWRREVRWNTCSHLGAFDCGLWTCKWMVSLSLLRLYLMGVDWQSRQHFWCLNIFHLIRGVYAKMKRCSYSYWVFNTHIEAYDSELPLCDTKKLIVISNVRVKALSTWFYIIFHSVCKHICCFTSSYLIPAVPPVQKKLTLVLELFAWKDNVTAEINVLPTMGRSNRLKTDNIIIVLQGYTF